MSRSIRRDLLDTLVTDGILLVLGILTGSLSARWLLPEGRGALAAALFWPQLMAGVGILSLPEATAYRMGSLPQKAARTASASFWLALALAGIALAVAFPLLPILLGRTREHLVWISQAYLVAFIPFHYIGLSLLGGDQGKVSFLRYNLLRLLVPVIYLAGLGILWVTGRIGVAGVVAANCAGTILIALVRISLEGRTVFFLPSQEEVRALGGLALRFHGTALLTFLASQADEWMVLFLWDDRALGTYAAALTLASTGLAVISGAFHKVLFPHLANLQEIASQRRLLSRGIWLAGALLAAVSVPLFIGMPWIIRLLFGPAFSHGVDLARILLVAYGVVALRTMIAQSLRGFGETRPGSVAAALELGLFLLLSIPLIQAWGLAGVAAGLGLANLGALGYLGYHLRRHHRMGLW